MNFDWAEEMNCAVTVCDTEGVVIYMNRRSRETFSKNGESMVGKSMIPCHNERSQAIIHDMLDKGCKKTHLSNTMETRWSCGWTG